MKAGRSEALSLAVSSEIDVASVRLAAPRGDRIVGTTEPPAYAT